jgi:carbamoyltransferase
MTRPIYILGIHDGHNCGATLTSDGNIVASISEERLTRTKNEVGYPRHSVEAVLKLAGISATQLDDVVYASLFMHSREHLTNIADWYKVGLSDQRAEKTRPGDYARIVFEQRRQERITEVCDHIGVAAKKVSFLEHHLCHAAAAYYTAPNAADGRPVLTLTCDGAGDNLAGTVSICRGNAIDRIAVIDRHASLGKIYSRVTLLLGMTPWEHEYKVMGLAPYADPARAKEASQALHALLKLSEDGLAFDRAGELSTNYCYYYLRDAFEATRFDTVSAAVQEFTEAMLVQWVQNCIAQTRIADVVCGGGLFMNVKANMKIAALPELRSMYVMPSAGDESLSIGACLQTFYQRRGFVDRAASTLKHLYLGGSYTSAEAEAAIASHLAGAPVDILQCEDVEPITAELLATGAIVARCCGDMEWGARALGNRSILTKADDFRAVDRINVAIKQRDFWMPFAPSIRSESAHRYFADPKGLNPRFMTFAFETLGDSRHEIVAASHPRDHTIRPQVVTRDANPRYHRLLSLFEERTGCGAVLNTSFNLHGFPIVQSPADAIDVFKRSGLTHLILNNHVISKRAGGWAHDRAGA